MKKGLVKIEEMIESSSNYDQTSSEGEEEPNEIKEITFLWLVWKEPFAPGAS